MFALKDLEVPDVFGIVLRGADSVSTKKLMI